MSIQILAISDLHGDLASAERLKDVARRERVDLVLLAGDLTSFGSLKDVEEVLSIFHPYPVFFVPGNCDPPRLAEVDTLDGALSLHGRGRTILGFQLLGVGGGTISPFNTPLELSEEAISSVLSKGLESLGSLGKAVLVTHMPPRGTRLDALTPLGPHVGSLAVKSFIERTRLRLCICGHIHQARGVDKVGEVTVVNPGLGGRGLYALVQMGDPPQVALGKV